MNTIYLSLGSNIGQSTAILKSAFQSIAHIPNVHLLRVSSLYRTSPVSPIPQADFINAACALQTTLSPEALYESLHQVELTLGKTPKNKNAPRVIDIDILFFGTQFHNTPSLCIPHPRWKERLFVLAPLSELIEEISFPINASELTSINIKKYLLDFSNPHNERVFVIE